MGALGQALGALTADTRALIEDRLGAHARSVGIRAAFLAFAAVLVVVFLLMSALAVFLMLSEAFDPPVAAAITAAAFLAVSLVAAVVALTVSFRPRSERTRQLPHAPAAKTIANDVGQLEQQLRELAGRNSGALVVAALVAGLAVALRKN